RKRCVLAVDQPIADESFGKPRFQMDVGGGKKQAGQRSRSTEHHVLTIAEDLPAPIANVDCENNGNMSQMREQFLETDIDVGDNSSDSSISGHTRQPPRSTDADFPLWRSFTPALLDRRRFLFFRIVELYRFAIARIRRCGSVHVHRTAVNF